MRSHTEVLTRDLYKAAALLALGGQIVGVGRYYPVIKLNIRVHKLALWYVEHIGFLPYRSTQKQREHLKALAKQHKPSKEELKVRKLYKEHFV